MEERLDKLFKEKLGGYKTTPRENAWGQLNEQLSNNRRNKWMKYVAVAASVLILISVGVISYNYISKIQPVSPAMSEVKNPEITGKEKKNQSLPSQMDQQKNMAPKVAEDNPDFKEGEVKDVEDIEPEPIETNPTQVTHKKEPQQQPILAMAAIEEIEARENLTENTQELDKISDQIEPESFVTDNMLDETNIEDLENSSEGIIENMSETSDKKSYPKVKIVYKASADSELIAEDKNLIDKSIKKITKFSDERIMTDKVKTRLRNTKEDLLALNFGKLLNKSNKDLEN